MPNGRQKQKHRLEKQIHFAVPADAFSSCLPLGIDLKSTKTSLHVKVDNEHIVLTVHLHIDMGYGHLFLFGCVGGMDIASCRLTPQS